MPGVEAADLEALRGELAGEVVAPEDAGYEEARTIWNAMIDRNPAAVVRPGEAADVAPAIGFAREHNLPLAVRGGGHNVAGKSSWDGGLVIDFSSMRGVDVDAASRTVRVEAGALLNDLDVAAAEHGLVVPGGTVSTIGVAGLTLGGGFGWLSRKLGLTVDSLISADLVTAEGELVTASDGSNPDLFWALRGGGGNFGVVTSFEFDAHELGPDLLCGLVVHPIESAREYLQHHREVVAQAPEELSAVLVARLAPPLPFLPEEVHGRPVVAVGFVYAGDPDEGERLVEEQIAGFGSPYGKHIGVMPFPEWQQGFDAMNAAGDRYYSKAHNLPELSDGVIDAVIDAVDNLPSPLTEVFILHMGGAVSKRPDDSTAYANRDANYILNVQGHWTDPADDARGIEWTRGLFDAVTPHATGTAYVNFLSEEGSDRVRDAYPPAVWSRLVEAKRRYDPDNVFRLNQNIPPD